MHEVSLPDWGDILWEDFRHLGLHGGRGAGKSRTIGTALVIQATQRHERVLCGREVQLSIKDSVKRLLDDEIQRLGLASVFESTEREIRGPNDSLFLFSGIKGNANAIKSIEGVTTFWGEEAQTFSQSSIETVVPTIRAPGSRLIWSWNPKFKTDPIDSLLRSDNPPPRSIVRQVNYDQNPWFPPELRAEMEYDRGRDYDKYRHIWLGEYYSNSDARVFKNWRVEEFETPTTVEHRLGADFGFSIDPSVAVRCHIVGRTIYIDYEAYGLGVEINNLPHLFMAIPLAEKYPMVADTSRPETISYLRNHGFPLIRAAVKGARSLEEGVEFLKSYDIVVHPRCIHVIEELTKYSFKVDSLTGLVTAVLEDKDNHCLDALRYAVEGARRALKPQSDAPVSIPRMSTAFNRR